jgi:hypothetical protein
VRNQDYLPYLVCEQLSRWKKCLLRQGSNKRTVSQEPREEYFTRKEVVKCYWGIQVRWGLGNIRLHGKCSSILAQLRKVIIQWVEEWTEGKEVGKYWQFLCFVSIVWRSEAWGYNKGQSWARVVNGCILVRWELPKHVC